MTTADPLDTILAEAGIDGDVIDAEAAGSLAGALGLDAATADEFVRTIAQFAEWDGSSAPDGEFELRVGSWKLDFGMQVSRSSLMAAILGAIMVATDTKEIGVALVAAIVPSIIDVDDISLSAGDEKLLIDVQRLPDVTDRLVRVDDLYDRLPEEIRDRVNKYDFADFIERVRTADQGVGDDKGRLIRVRKPGEDIPVIRWS